MNSLLGVCLVAVLLVFIVVFIFLLRFLEPLEEGLALVTRKPSERERVWWCARAVWCARVVSYRLEDLLVRAVRLGQAALPRPHRLLFDDVQVVETVDDVHEARLRCWVLLAVFLRCATGHNLELPQPTMARHAHHRAHAQGKRHTVRGGGTKRVLSSATCSSTDTT